MSKDGNPGRIISGSYPAPPLMGRVLFNYNRVFNGFEFIFSNPRWIRGRVPVLLFSPCPDYIFKLFFYYFISYFNINNNNNKNVF